MIQNEKKPRLRNITTIASDASDNVAVSDVRMSDNAFAALVEAAAKQTAVINGRKKPINRSRMFNPVKLSELNTDHMSHDQRVKFEAAIASAIKWSKTAVDTPSLSFVLSGDTGAGKTGIGVAMARGAEAVIKRRDRAHFDRTGEWNQSRSAFKIVDASALMKSVSGGDRDGNGREIPFRASLGRYATFVLNNVGSETVPYSNAATIDGMRQGYYLEFIDWLWSSGRHVIVTTTCPLLHALDDSGENVVVSDAFKFIFGDEAYGRLYQMASGGYMHDLVNIPNYREIANKDGVK